MNLLVSLRIGADGAMQMAGRSASWRVSGGQLHIEAEGKTFSYDYEVSADTLQVWGGDISRGVRITWERSSGGAQ